MTQAVDSVTFAAAVAASLDIVELDVGHAVAEFDAVDSRGDQRATRKKLHRISRLTEYC